MSKGIFAFVLFASAAMGQETLTYTSTSLIGTVQLAQALVPNQSNQVAIATAYSFSITGLLSFSPGPQPFGLSDQQQTFVFSTDANGNVTSWSLNISAFADPENAGFSVNFISSLAGDLFAETICDSADGCVPQPVVQSAAGVWAVASITPTAPQPTVAQLQAQIAALQAQVATLQAQAGAASAWIAVWQPYYEWQANGCKARAATLAQQLANANLEISDLRAELMK
jgi:hypothetical protein